jgi:hypothetical protein
VGWSAYVAHDPESPHRDLIDVVSTEVLQLLKVWLNEMEISFAPIIWRG